MSVGTASLLIVDDDPTIRKILADRFRVKGYEVGVASNGVEALTFVDACAPNVILLDLQMPEMDGFAVLEELKKRSEMPTVIVITAHGSIEAAVRAVKAGAADLITKPFDSAHLEHLVSRVLEQRGMAQRIEDLESEISSRHSLVMGASTAMKEAVDKAQRAAASDATVLLLGESGTGKEVIARAIHRASRRKARPFIAVNCATLGGELLESELFGHERGAFTGAVRSKPGKLEQAESGTLFLDEVGELSGGVQAKLLRVIQEREFQRVGGTRMLPADVRIVAATNRNLNEAVKQGAFRQDLFYRLNVVAIRLPPLRDRSEDIPALLEHFLRRFAAQAGRQDLRMTAQARQVLCRYAWPGNVRELVNVIERAVVLTAGNSIDVGDLPEEIIELSEVSEPRQGSENVKADVLPYHQAVLEAKRGIIRNALSATGGHQTRAASLLGVGQPYLARLIKNLKLRED